MKMRGSNVNSGWSNNGKKGIPFSLTSPYVTILSSFSFMLCKLLLAASAFVFLCSCRYSSVTIFIVVIIIVIVIIVIIIIIIIIVIIIIIIVIVVHYSQYSRSHALQTGEGDSSRSDLFSPSQIECIFARKCTEDAMPYHAVPPLISVCSPRTK